MFRCRRYLAQNVHWGHHQYRFGVWKCWFLRRGESRPTWRKPLRVKTTQPSYDTGSGNRTQATLVGGECSYRCTIPGPLRESVPPRVQRLLPSRLLYSPILWRRQFYLNAGAAFGLESSMTSFRPLYL